MNLKLRLHLGGEGGRAVATKIDRVELPRWDATVEELIHLVHVSAFRLRDEKVSPDAANRPRRPRISIRPCPGGWPPWD